MQDTKKFAKYLGKLKINVGSEDLELDVRMGDVVTLSSISEEDVAGEGFSRSLETFLNIMKRSYPDEDPVAMEKFLIRNIEDMFSKFTIGMGWTTEEKMKEKSDEINQKK